MSTSALSSPTVQPIKVSVNTEFTFHGKNCSAILELEAMISRALIRCNKCGKSTQDIMKEIGLSLSINAGLTNVEKVLANLPDDPKKLVLDQEYVFLITKAATIKITNIGTGAKTDQSEALTREIDARVKEKLIGHAVCNVCCFINNHLGSLLDN